MVLAAKLTTSNNLKLHQRLREIWRDWNHSLLIALAMNKNVVIPDLLWTEGHDFIQAHASIKEKSNHGSVASRQIVAPMIVIEHPANFQLREGDDFDFRLLHILDSSSGIDVDVALPYSIGEESLEDFQ